MEKMKYFVVKRNGTETNGNPGPFSSCPFWRMLQESTKSLPLVFVVCLGVLHLSTPSVWRHPPRIKIVLHGCGFPVTIFIGTLLLFQLIVMEANNWKSQ